ncbi:hypothetical protein DFS33DRAFT_1266058 [Desarmillaria ectypa]|nr:hypothetical protein DFS33DRAFT_1266058 [Desarmillaria ectypa]
MSPFGIILNAIHVHPRSAILLGVIGLSVPWLVEDYHRWLRLGKAALPYNPIGWLLAVSLKPFGRETLSTIEYSQDPNNASWLERAEIPERRGSRPFTGWHIAPHRQLDRTPRRSYPQGQRQAVFAKHAEANQGVVEIYTSRHERLGDGMYLRSSVPAPHDPALQAQFEMGHIHPQDSSMHFMLSSKDCKLVIEQGWGERHPLSGVSKWIPMPKEYLLIYAPRNDEELAVIEHIIMASIGYMSNSQNVI